MKTVKTFGTFKKFLKPFAVLFTAGLLFSIFYSCEIGLGGAVDTQPPKITITNPPVDAVIRDNFAICGTYDDDGTIKSVSAVLTRPDKKGKDIELTEFTLTGDANIKGAGTWTIPVNALDAQGTKLIADGTYQASITIKDAAGRSTLQNTTFTVDNTAPVIVLQRPGTDLNATISNADTYGRTFSLEGLGADDNNIDHIDVMVYSDKEKTNLLYPVTLSNVPPSISMNVAEYGDAAYTAIYGNVDPANFAPAQFYCTIKAYDSAARYPGDDKLKTPEDSLGNSTDVYYIYEDISKDVLKSTKITEVYHIVSGTALLDPSRSAADTNLILTKLAQNEQKLGSFVLDPKNNPTFSLAGKPTLLPATECLDEGTDYTVPNDSDITIQAAVGLDNSPIVDNEEFKVYFQKAVFQNGKYVATGPKIYPEIDSVNGKKKSGSNYQFTVKVKSSDGGLEVNNSYLIGMGGEDENGQPFLPANNGYGFYILSTSSAPTLKDIDPPDSTIYVKKDGSLTITGKTTLTEGKPTVSIRYNDVNWTEPIELTQPIENSTSVYAFELTIPASRFNDNAKNAQGVVQSKEFALEIRSASGGKSSSTYKTVLYDVDEPIVNELTVTPEILDSVNHAGKYVLNGEVTIKALLEDIFTAVKEWKYTVIQEGKTIPDGPTKTNSKVEFTFDTTQLTNEKEAVINIVAVDKAGNIKTYPINCYVDQSTDKPTFGAQDETSWKTGVLNPYYINANTNNASVVIKNIISGDIYSKVCDDDSVKLVKFEVQAIKPKADLTGVSEEDKADPTKALYDNDDVKQATLKAAEKLNYYSDRTGKEISITHKMPAKSGFYLITQTVYDKNFVMAGSTPTAAEEASQPNYCSKASYVIKASGTGPQFNLVRDSSYLSPNNLQNQLKVTIEIESGDEPFTIKRIAKGNTIELEPAWSSNTYEDTFTTNDIWTNDSTISVSYEITDLNGTTTKEIKYSKDSEDPTFTNPKIETNSETYSVYKVKDENTYYLNNKNQIFTISGLAEDNNGVGNVHLEINNPGGTGKKIEKDSETGYFTGIKFAGCIENAGTENETTNNNDWTGTATIDITVTDIAGNTFEYPQITAYIDTTAPVGQHKVDAKKKDIIFRIGNNDNDDIDESYNNPANGPVWTPSIDTDVGGKYSDGTYGNAETIKLRGFFEDSGSGVDLIYYKVFKTQPNDDNQLAQKFLKDGNKTYETQADGYFSLITPVEKRVFYTKTNNGVTTDWGGTQLVGSSSKWYIDDVKYNFYTTISGLSSGENYLVFVAVDKVGNAALEEVTVPGEGTFNNYKINVDQVPPTVPNEKIYTSTSFYNPDNDDGDNLFVVYGIANDTAAGIREASVKINGTELTGVYNKNTKVTTLKSGNTEVGTLQLMTAVPNDAPDAAKTKYDSETFSDNNKLWKIELNQSAFAGLTNGSSASLSLKVIDNAGAGNSETYPVANVMIDNAGPTVTISSPSNNDEVNGKIKLSVSASDGNGAGVSADNPVLYKKNGNSWDELSNSLHSFANGTFTVDTTKFTDNANVVLKVSYKDNVENTGDSAELTLKVNQDADRPIITLSQLDASEEVTLRLKNVYGSIIDDDGNVTKMWYWSKQKKKTVPTTAPTTTNDNGWTPITVNGGSWSVDTTSVESDGETTWYFAVQDNADRIFWIGEGANNTPATLDQPYFKYKTGNEQNVPGGITFKYDTDAPKITDFWLYRMATPGQGETALTATQIMGLDNDADEDKHPQWTNKRDTVFGKDYNLLYAKVIVDEGTEMRELSGSNGAAPTSSPITISYKQQEDVEYSYNREQILCAHEDNSTIYTYYIGPIVMDTTEKTDFTVTAYDGVGLSGSSKISIIVDNTPPTGISRVRPNSAGEVSGDVTYTGGADDDTNGGSGVATVEWCIPTKAQSLGAATQNGLIWHEVIYNATWEIDFAGDYNLSNIIGYTTASGTPEVNAAYEGFETGTDTGVYLIPVWFKLTDAVGNVGYDTTNGLLRYNPNTDRPSVLIGNPTHNKTAEINGNTINYVVMGGSNARISGSADDNEGIGSVYLQFDMDADGYWDTGVKGLSADLNAQPTNSTELIAGTPWTYDKIEKIVTKKNLVQTAEFGYGIKVGTTKSWSYTLDLSSSELKHITETEISTGVYSYSGETIRIRAIAIDNDDEGGQLASAWSDVLNVSVNNEIPLFSNLKIKQIKNGSTVSELDYVDGKYLKGENWYITGDVGTNNGLSEASYTGVTDALSCFTLKNGSTTQYDMKIPVNPTNGVWDVEIFVYDNTTPTKKQGSQKIKINIDNTPPNFADEYEASQYAVNGTVKHYLNNYGSKGTEITPSVDIIDENELISLWGSVKDSGSGFAKAVFYFKRLDANGSSNPRVYNPMSDSNNRTNLNGSKAVGKVYIDNSEGGDNLPALYVKTDDTAKMTVSRPDINSIKVVLREGSTVTGVTNNGNIRKGGLIKIGGVYRTITDIAGDGTVTFDTDCDTSFVEAEFIYALVVDSTGETKSGNTINEQDGDGVWENYTILPDGTATWNAAFTTSNIPDGPVELHVVVFDEAGNFNHGYTKAKICNNPLRITKVLFGTDLNGDNNYDIDTEFEQFYAFTQTTGSHDLSKGEPIWDLDTKKILGGSSSYTVKKGLAVIPEFVGGTGDIYYKFEKREAKLTAAQTIASTSNSNMLQATINSITGTINAERDGNKIGKLVLENTTINSNTREDVESYFSFSFWDSMEAATPGTNSSCTVLNAQIKQDLIDNKKPNIVIEPFRWAGAGEEGKDIKTEIVRKFTYSTVKGNKGYARYDFYTDAACTVPVNTETTDDAIVYTKQSVSVNSLYKTLGSNGHIELSEDLPATTFSSTGLYDTDPKVSGKITFSGTAYDDVGLSSIWFSFDGFTPTGYYSTTDNYGASGKKTGVTVAQSVTKDFYQAAYYNPSSGWQLAGAKVDEGNTPAGWEFTVENEYFNQNGHKVLWTLSIDTSKIDGVAGTDKTLYVLAVDHNAETAGTDTTTVSAFGDTATNSQLSADDGTNVTKYKVDVVPYITGVETSISSFLSKDYTRSAIGDYPIKRTGNAGETVKVSGFNLNPTNKAVDTNTVKSDVRLSKNKTALDGTTKKGTGLKVEAGTGNDAGKWLVTMSATGNGYLTFFTNGIPSLNNVDSNSEYNQETSLIHATLNNDRKFTLWSFTSLRTNNSAPKANGATYPSMAMNDDTPQFTYVNNVEGYGLAEFWNGTTETKIYENWDLFTYTSLALNSSGSRAALYDINVVQGGTGYASDAGGIMTNFFNNPSDSAWNSTCYYFRKYNVWMDGLYKQGVTAVLGRYQYPTIKMVGNNNISHVFYSVYDSLEDRVVFRYFTVGTSNTLVSNATAINDGNNNKVYLNKNQLNQVAANGSWPTYKDSNNANTRFTNYGNYAGTTTNPQTFATGSTVGLYTATAGVPVTTTDNGNITAARGILVYYAGTNMYYTYAKNDANTSWSDPVVLDSNCEASYISMVVDDDNHVHIAYQNNIAGDVKYIYIPSYSAPATRKSVTVDSYLTVGDKLTLDVIGSTPYIGYKGLGNTAKVAWYVANNGVPAVGTLSDGIDADEKFTGSWNVEIIPNRIVDSDTNRFNVGVGRTSKNPVIGYSNNQSGSKGIEYLTRSSDLAE